MLYAAAVSTKENCQKKGIMDGLHELEKYRDRTAPDLVRMFKLFVDERFN